MAARRAGERSTTGRPQRTYTIRDQVALRRLHDFVVSPDGSRLILADRERRSRPNRLDTHLWSITRGWHGPAPVDPVSGRRNRTPCSRPMGGVSISWRVGAPATARSCGSTSTDGRPIPVTRSPVDIESFVLSRDDGTHLAFSAMVFPGGPDTLASTAERLKADARQDGERRGPRSAVRPALGSVEDRPPPPPVRPARGRGPAVDVMPAMDADAPSKPFGGAEQYTFTPDGRGIVFTARDVGREEAWSTDLDLFVAPIDGSSAPRKLTSENRATDTDPAFSPDGTLLAYLAMDRAGYEADKLTVILRSWPGGDVRRLTDDWDRSVERLEWSPDGRTLYVTRRGHRAARSVRASTSPRVRSRRSSPRATSRRRRPSAMSSSTATTRSRPRPTCTSSGWSAPQAHPVERVEAAGRRTRRGRAVLVRRLERRDRAMATCSSPPASTRRERIRSRSSSTAARRAAWATTGTTAGTRRSTPAPDTRSCSIDFHGSTGYGQAFTDSIRGDWGGKPLDDLRSGLRGSARSIPVPRSDASRGVGRELRRLHDQPDGRRLERAMALPRHPRRHARRAVSPTSRPRSSGSPSGSTGERHGRTRQATPGTIRSTTSLRGAFRPW